MAYRVLTDSSCNPMGTGITTFDEIVRNSNKLRAKLQDLALLHMNYSKTGSPEVRKCGFRLLAVSS